jgi:hypothetical protein
MEKKEMEETSRTLLPIIIEVKSMLDLIEINSQGAIMHRELDSVHYYYNYLSIGESLMVLMIFKTNIPFKRYIGNLKGKVLDNDEANSDSYICIVEVLHDPILELSLTDDDNGEENKKMP